MTTDGTDNTHDHTPDRAQGNIRAGGETLSARDEAVLRAVESGEGGGADAATSRLIADMRRDREALRSAATEPVPDGLLESAIIAAFDGASGELPDDVLARLEHGAPGENLPVSRVVPERAGVIGWITRNPGRSGFAVAAAAALLLCGTAIVSVLTRPAVSPDALALGDRTQPATPVGPAPVEIAANPSGPTDAAPGEPVSAPGTRLTDRVVLAAGTPVGDVFAGAELLREGRLMILARGGSADRVRPALEALAGYRVGPDHTFALAAGMDEKAMARLRLPDLAAPAIASDDHDGLARTILPERSAWTGTLRDTPNALASLVDALRDAGLTVELLELREPVPSASRPSAEDVLWWSRPPGTWSRTVTAPVVVEALP